MKSILIHSCCAHCAAYATQYWREQGYETHALWYNPNIHPYTEHQRRLEAMQSLTQQMKLPLIVTAGYDIINYFRQVAEHDPGVPPQRPPGSGNGAGRIAHSVNARPAAAGGPGPPCHAPARC